MARGNTHGTFVKGLFFALFGALFALMVGVGTRYFLYDHQVPDTLCESVAFEGPVSDDALNLSGQEIRGLNKSADKWKKSFPVILVQWTPKENVDAIRPNTILECNVKIRTSSDHNIIMRKKKMTRRDMVEVIVRQVDHAGSEYSMFRKSPGRAGGGIRTIHL